MIDDECDSGDSLGLGRCMFSGALPTGASDRAQTEKNSKSR